MSRLNQFLLLIVLGAIASSFLPATARSQEAGELLVIKVVCRGEGSPVLKLAKTPDAASTPPDDCTPTDGLRKATFQVFDATTGEYLLDLQTDSNSGAVSALLYSGTYELTETDGVMPEPLRVKVTAGQTTAIQALDFTQLLTTPVCSMVRPAAEAGDGAAVVEGGPLLNWRLPIAAGLQASQVAVAGDQVVVGLSNRTSGALVSLARGTGEEQ